MTYFNKIKDITIEGPQIVVPRVGGEFEMEAFQGFEFPQGSGKVWEYPGTTRKLAKFDNLITNFGLNKYGTAWEPDTGADGTYFYQNSYCHVGTGTAAESASDTALASFVAGKVATSTLGSFTAQGAPPYYGSLRTDYLFSPNFAGGAVNLNEIGTSFTVTTGNINSRALTKDNNGNPATVPVLANEYLRVYYTRRNYPGHIVELTGAPSDLTGSVLIGGVSYNYTMRPAHVTSNDWGEQCCTAFRPAGGFGYASNISGLACGSDSVLGAVTTGISSASVDQQTSTSAGSYTLNSNNRTASYFWDIDRGNVSGGIKGLVVQSSLGSYQILLSSAVPKNSGNALTYYHNWTWARK